MAGGEPIRVMLVDDQEDIRFIVGVILGDHDDISLVAGVATAREALDCFDAMAPDVAIVDVRMPIVDGFELTGMLLERRPELPVALLTSLVDDGIRRQAQAVGARTVADKADFYALPDLVRQLAAG